MGRLFLRLVSRLGITGKLATIYILDLMVTASIIVSFVGDKVAQIDFSQKELEGTAIVAPVRQLYQDLLRDVRVVSGDGAVLAKDLAATDAARRQHGGDMALDADWAALSASAADYAAARAGADREAAFRTYQDKLSDFLASVGDRSNLILDPDLDSYYSMAIAVVDMRDIVKNIEELSAVALDAGPTEGRTIKLSALEAEIGRTRADIRHSIDAGTSGNIDGKFSANIGPSRQRFDAALDALIATVKSGGDVRAATDQALDSSFGFWSSTTTELNRLLHLRIKGLNQQTVAKLGLTLLLALAVLAAVTFIGLQIARPVRELVSVAASVRSGDPRRAVWDSSDEFGSLVAAFNGMLDRLGEESQRREEMAAAAHAAEAQRDLLEAIALPVVVTSLDGTTVLHANAAARALLGAQIGEGFRGLDLLARAQGGDIVGRLGTTGALDEVEVEITSRDGATGWMLLSARRVDYHGQDVALFSLTPVNELKRTQAALRDAKEAAEITAERLRSTTDTLMASIRYASRIQNSIFPDRAAVRELTHRAEIWVEQRDIVGGDWHWVGHVDAGDLVFLCDCTGHGVPGALMTMLVSSCFRRAIEEQGYASPARILTSLHRQVRLALSRASGEMSADDGLDAACVFLEHATGLARIAGARLAMLHADATGLHEIKGDRTSIGYPSLPEHVTITEREIPVAAGDLLYLFTDGCTDQMGGERRNLFGRRRLFAAIDRLRALAPAEQIAQLRALLAEYRGDEPARDDATLIVLRMNDEPAIDELPMPLDEARGFVKPVA
jgi:serine phosphatase RsbU (regulator of sigma subunit)/HAMP domain-containing protein